ncbi:MAG TPA: PAS domain-containing protein [Aquabacterium sp.]|uniref:sensor histidine kinase n=1 Tax=Aquabacterium sp. TaxID=1872578 RepID=UPI002E37805B|nr:PAS domain-containing protein [Aquabacterium sp.]HEX5355830.1 PAS domain-containing protein [Aquabacterium sp.]
MSDQQHNDLSYYMRRLVDHVPSMLAYWDKDLRCRFANKAYKVWFGLTPEQIIGIRMEELLGPRLFALNESYIRGALAGQEQLFERIVPGPDGVQRHSLANYLPDIVDGQVQGFLVQVTEITRLKETEAALRASEAFLDQTGRMASVGGWEVDLRTNAVKWSDQVCRIYDLPPGYQPTREEARQFVDPEAREWLLAKVASGTQSGKPWEAEVPVITAKGRRIWLRCFCEVEFKDGQAVRMFGAVQDITELRSREAELRQEQSLRRRIEQQVVELDRLLKERSEMLDVLAHEVRQPLNNASAAMQSAKASLTGLQDMAAAQRVDRAQKVMNQVMANIDNTLAVAALLAQSAPITRQDTDIDTLIGVVVADMPADERERIQIERLTSTRTASMDMSLMRLALRNLLANALKFSPPDEKVTIQISDSDAPLALIIDVVDHGPGVASDIRPHLFERGAHTHQQPQTGHGLGLYIVRRVMELHGGQVGLVDRETPGTTMRLSIIQAPGS